MSGRHPLLTYPKLRLVDRLFAERKLKKTRLKQMARIVGVSITTLRDASKRRNAYKDCARG